MDIWMGRGFQDNKVDMVSVGRMKDMALPDSTRGMVSGGIPEDIYNLDNILGMVLANNQVDRMFRRNKSDMGC